MTNNIQAALLLLVSVRGIHWFHNCLVQRTYMNWKVQSNRWSYSILPQARCTNRTRKTSDRYRRWVTRFLCNSSS